MSTHYAGTRFAKLAVFLGLGTAIATGHGVAHADPTDSGGDSSATSESSTSATEQTTNAATGTSESGSTQGTKDTGSSVGTIRPPDMQLPKPRDGDDEGESDAKRPEAATKDGVETEPSTPAETPEGTTVAPIRHSDEQRGRDHTPVVHSQPRIDARSAPSEDAKAEAPTRAAATAAVESTQSAPTDEPAVVHEAPSPVALRTMAAVDTSVAPLAQAAVVAPPATNVVAQLVQRILNPFVGAAAPGAPAQQPPLLWTVLAFARREIENLLWTKPPTVSPTVTTDTNTGKVTIDLGATGGYRDPVRVSVVTPTQDGNLTPNADGTYTYTPDTAFAHSGGIDQFTVRVVDTGFHPRLLSFLQPDFGRSTTTTITLTVSATNAAPTLDPTSTAGADGVVTGSLGGRDTDGDRLTYAVTDEPTKGTLTLNADGTFSYTPNDDDAHAAAKIGAPDDAKWDTFSVTVSDGHGATTPGEVTVAVTPRNAKPVLLPSSAVDPATGVVAGSVGGYDDDHDGLTYAVVTQPGKGTLTLNPDGTFSYRPGVAFAHDAAEVGAPDSAKWDVFTVSTSDGYGGISVGDVKVYVTGQNTRPTVTPESTADAATGVVTGTVGGADDDRDDLTYQLVSDGGKGKVTLNDDGTFSYVPNADAAHAAAKDGATDDTKWDTFTVAVSDGHGGTTVAEVTVAVTPQNTDPKMNPRWRVDDPTTGKVIGAMAGTDDDGDQITYSVGRQPTKGTLTLNPDGSFTYVPFTDAAHAAAADGATLTDKRDTFVLVATDGYGGTKTPEWTVPVTAQNKTFTLTQTTTTDPTTGVVTVNLGYQDGDGDTLSYVIVDPATKGIVTVDPTGTGTITFTPTTAGKLAPGTTDTIVVKVTDGHGDPQYVTVNATVPHETVVRQSPIDLGNADLPIGEITISSDGKTAYLPTPSNLYVIDLQTKAVTHVGLYHYGDVNDIVTAPDGTLYAIYTTSGSSKQAYAIKIDPVTGTDVDSHPLGRNGIAIAVSPDGKYVYAARAGSDTGNVEDGRLWILNASDFSDVATLSGVTRLPRAMVISPDGSTAYFAHGSYGVAERAVQSGVVAVDVATKEEREIPMYYGAQTMALNADGSKLNVTSAAGGAYLTSYDPATGAELGQFKFGDDNDVLNVALSRDGSVAYVAAANQKKIYVVNTATMQQISAITVSGTPYEIAVAPDDTVYVSYRNSAVLGVITVS